MEHPLEIAARWSNKVVREEHSNKSQTGHISQGFFFHQIQATPIRGFEIALLIVSFNDILI